MTTAFEPIDLSEWGPRRPRETAVQFEARDGHPLAGTLFEPLRDNGFTVQVDPAYAVPRGYYAPYARHLAARGFTVLTFDYRGIGGSVARDWRGEAPTMTHWGARDLAAGIDWLAARYPRHRQVHVAHSAGGQLLGLAPNNHKVEALLAIASQSGWWKLRHGLDRLRAMRDFFVLLPGLAQLSRLVPQVRRGAFAPPPTVALEFARWGRRPEYIPQRRYFEQYRGRMRFVHVTDDTHFAPLAAVEALAGFYRNADVEVVSRLPADYGLTRLGHFGFFRASMPRAAWDETVRWLLGATQASRAGVRRALTAGAVA